MLRRLLPITLRELGVYDRRVVELVADTKEKRDFYFRTLFPKVAGDVESVGLRFDEKLIWRITDELLEKVAAGEMSLDEG
jgi:hypothetical protein